MTRKLAVLFGLLLAASTTAIACGDDDDDSEGEGEGGEGEGGEGEGGEGEGGEGEGGEGEGEAGEGEGEAGEGEGEAGEGEGEDTTDADYCACMSETCPDQYENDLGGDEGCLDTAAGLDHSGEDGTYSGDTIQCRISHCGAAGEDPDTHCGHATLVPSDECVD